MPTIQERLVLSSQNFMILSRNEFYRQDFKSASELATCALGIDRFLWKDEDTPEEIRAYIRKTGLAVRQRIDECNGRLANRRIDPKMSGRSNEESQADRLVSMIDEAIDAAAEGVELE